MEASTAEKSKLLSVNNKSILSDISIFIKYGSGSHSLPHAVVGSQYRSCHQDGCRQRRQSVHGVDRRPEAKPEKSQKSTGTGSSRSET
jgi:hypothetical protein